MAIADRLPVEEVSATYAAEARPGPVGRVLAQAGPDRIERDVTKRFFELIIALDCGRAKSSFEEMAVNRVAIVEFPRVRAVELMHPSGERLVLRLDHQVKVIRHQAVRDVAPTS
jgi:hypothetical protein